MPSTATAWILLRRLVVVSVVALMVGTASIARASDVVGDDQNDVYIGTGGLILPGSVDQDTRQVVASCRGCSWKLTTPCITADLGQSFDGQPTCLSVVRGCPGGQLLRSWFKPEAGAWRDTGLICKVDTDVLTVNRLGAAAAERVPALLPDLAPSFQPARGVLTQLPVLFDSGQRGGAHEFRLALLGQSVTITARPAWTWQFGDGAELRTADPGGRFPSRAVAHVYRSAGVFTLTCSARWSASFTVDGLGPFPVEASIVQREEASIGVGEGRALLSAR